MNKMSAISVVTICFNNPGELKQTCASVDEQSLLPVEHLIIDGSANGEILRWLSDHPQPAYRRWIHERDEGISDAFNKGVRQATGDIIHLLNSGDRYADKNAIAVAAQVFASNTAIMWTHSKYLQHRGNTDVVSGVPFDRLQLWKGMRTVAHPTMFIKKEVYERYGLYDTAYKIAMDYDLLVRIRNERSFFIAQPLVYFAPGGASNLHFEKGLREVRKSYALHVGSSYKQIAWQLRQRLLHGFMQTGLGRKWFRWKNRKSMG